MSAPTDLSRLRLGTAPDSWGVWFPEDPHQVTWQQYLDEVAKAGYVYTELGPQGFLPQDPAQLRDELESRGLQVCGGTVFAALHHGKEALDAAIEAFGREARLLSAVGAKYLIHLPAAVHGHAQRRGRRYIVNPPGADVRIHQHNEIGNGDVKWDEFFATLRELNFDGVATVCVFGWEEEADALHRRMRERVAAELKA
jgi:sugar phosphate isomerase/epimerase